MFTGMLLEKKTDLVYSRKKVNFVENQLPIVACLIMTLQRNPTVNPLQLFCWQL
jgi:hypothetical protein